MQCFLSLYPLTWTKEIQRVMTPLQRLFHDWMPVGIVVVISGCEDCRRLCTTTTESRSQQIDMPRMYNVLLLRSSAGGSEFGRAGPCRHVTSSLMSNMGAFRRCCNAEERELVDSGRLFIIAVSKVHFLSAIGCLIACDFARLHLFDGMICMPQKPIICLHFI